TVAGEGGARSTGWGETPLSVQWAWPSALPYEERHETMKAFCRRLVDAWGSCEVAGHPVEIGHHFLEERLPQILDRANRARGEREPMPWLAALICCSAFDLAVHDAYGRLHARPTYETYTGEFMNADLAQYLAE